MAILNRTDFQKLSIERLDDAKALLSAGRGSGAYYLAGYVIECALKACIAKNTSAGDFAPSPDVVRNDYYKHDVKTLLKTADLVADLDLRRKASADFSDNWLAVIGWSEAWRYSTSVSVREASDLISAIEDPQNGVLPWLQMHW